MTKDFPELTDVLVELTDEQAPPSTVSAERAIQAGRQRRRRRRLAAAATATAVAVAVTTLTLMPSGGAGASHVGPAESASPSATPSAGPSVSPAGDLPSGIPDSEKYVPATGGDPLVVEALFGWLPDWVGGSAGVGYESTFEAGIVTEARGKDGMNAPRIMLNLYPVGTTPALDAPGSRPLHTVDAPPVNGHPAYWAVDGDTSDPLADGRAVLRWQAPSGRWVELTAYPVDYPNASATLLRVAAGVTFRTTQIPLPLRITGLPADFKPVYAMLSRPDRNGKGPWDVTLIFETAEHASVSVSVRPTPPAPTEPAPAATETVGAGAPPGAQPDPETCSNDQGLQVCVSTPQAAAKLDGVGGIQGLLGKVSLFGLDESKWTTKVLD